MELPGGRAATTVHVGPYDTMVKTYEEMRMSTTAQGLTRPTICGSAPSQTRARNPIPRPCAREPSGQ